ncbi:MAG: restriction endonuclease subunit S [Clostridiaceae bacterium]
MTRKMKDSGVEWIGEIPEDWDISKIKYCTVKIGSGKTPKGGSEVYSTEGVLFIRSQNVYDTGLRLDEVSYISDDIDKEMQGTRVYYNDVLLNITGASIGRSCIYLVEDQYANVNQHVCIIRTNQDLVLPKYMNYFWMSPAGKTSIDIFQSGANREGMNFEQIANTFIPYSSIKEQEKIVNYLDRKCLKIDETIEREKQVIEKLKAYKQSVITEVVTKGLNPDVQMKESGIEWIGKIPEHWNLIRLRYIAKCQNGISKSAEFFGTGFPFVSYGDVYKNIVLPELVEGLVESTESDRKAYSVEEGDIFFTRTSETIEEIGLTCVCEKTIENATFAGFLIRVRPFMDNLVLNFSKYYFSSNIHRRFFVKEMNLVTRASLSQELLKKLPVLMPPIEEQDRIANYLDDKCSKIDNTITQKEKLIQKLTDYKKSLIFECVTGKMEV